MENPTAASAPFFDALRRTACALFSVSDAAVRLGDAWMEPGPSAIGTVGRGERVAAWLHEAGAAAGLAVAEDVAAVPALQAALDGADPPVRFLAGVPLAMHDGTVAGVLCLFGDRPRPFRPEEAQRLRDLATIAAEHVAAEARATEAAREEELYRLLAENSTDTIVRGNLDGVRLYISPAVRSLLGYEPEELIGRRAMDIVHPDDAETFGRTMSDVRAGRIDLVVDEQRQRHKNGHWVWLEAFVKLTRDKVTGEPDGYVASVRDVSRRKAAEAQLAHFAAHDPLTGLANRRRFDEAIEREWRRAKRTGSTLALLMIDADRFKRLNDTFGHMRGDEVLKAIAGLIDGSIRRPGDMAARFGGEEFVAILPDTDAAGAATIAERIRRNVELRAGEDAGPSTVTVSIGVSAMRPADGASASDLVASADLALYRAKAAGRNRIAVETLPPAT